MKSARFPAASDHRAGTKEKRKKAASFQTVSQLHKVRGGGQMRGSKVDPRRQKLQFVAEKPGWRQLRLAVMFRAMIT